MTTRSAKKRLGRGLDSLMSLPVSVEQAKSDDTSQLQSIATSDIHPNPHQPRQAFSAQAIDALAESIRTAGLMQPVIVRNDPAGGYQLIAGERRWRAAKSIGMAELPAIVRQVSNQEAAEFALIENVQREDLNPMERAEAFARLANDFGMTHQDIAQRVGIERSNVSNHMRLLDLDEEFKESLRTRQMSMGHARALLAIANYQARHELAREAISSGMSVRDVERRARQLAKPSTETASSGSDPQQAHLQDLQRRLGEHLGTKVELRRGKSKGAGQLIINFYSFDEFEGLLDRLQFPREGASDNAVG